VASSLEQFRAPFVLRECLLGPFRMAASRALAELIWLLKLDWRGDRSISSHKIPYVSRSEMRSTPRPGGPGYRLPPADRDRPNLALTWMIANASACDLGHRSCAESSAFRLSIIATH
jgi:hypothetical protein